MSKKPLKPSKVARNEARFLERMRLLSSQSQPECLRLQSATLVASTVGQQAAQALNSLNQTRKNLPPDSPVAS